MPAGRVIKFEISGVLLGGDLCLLGLVDINVDKLRDVLRLDPSPLAHFLLNFAYQLVRFFNIYDRQSLPTGIRNTFVLNKQLQIPLDSLLLLYPLRLFSGLALELHFLLRRQLARRQILVQKLLLLLLFFNRNVVYQDSRANALNLEVLIRLLCQLVVLVADNHLNTRIVIFLNADFRIGRGPGYFLNFAFLLFTLLFFADLYFTLLLFNGFLQILRLLILFLALKFTGFIMVGFAFFGFLNDDLRF